jgi:hypothetical protein
MNVLARSSILLLALLAAPPMALGNDDAGLQRKAYLSQELAAAKSEKFYLVFDGAVPAIDLKIEGVRVHRFALDKAEFGRSRLAGQQRHKWPASSFTLVSELPEPDRPQVEIQKADAAAKAHDEEILKALAKGQTPAGELSETAGEKVAHLYQTEDADAPLTYRLQFDPGLVLVVRGEPRAMDLGSRLRRIKYALVDGFQGFARWLDNKPVDARVVVYLPPEDARSLFRVLTPDIRLLVYAAPASR